MALFRNRGDGNSEDSIEPQKNYCQRLSQRKGSMASGQISIESEDEDMRLGTRGGHEKEHQSWTLSFNSLLVPILSAMS
jgi:hypothetical protein